MSKLFICMLSIMPIISHAAENSCASIDSSMELSLFEAITQNLNISENSIQRDKTQVVLLDSSPISTIFANQLAHIDYEADKKGTGTALLSEKEYQSTYKENGVMSITAKYIYTNKDNKKDVFIATSLMNKDECSIRFNGYLTLSREF